MSPCATPANCSQCSKKCPRVRGLVVMMIEYAHPWAGGVSRYFQWFDPEPAGSSLSGQAPWRG